MRARERWRKEGFEGRDRDVLGHNPRFPRNGEGAGTDGVKASPVRLAYQTNGVEVTALV